MNGRAKTKAEVRSPNSGPLCSLRVPVPKHVLSWEGHRWRAWPGLWDEVCVPAAERPTPLSTPPTHPRGLGLGTDLKASRTGKACPGWMRFVASAEPCPLWVCSHSTVLVASS